MWHPLKRRRRREESHSRSTARKRRNDPTAGWTHLLARLMKRIPQRKTLQDYERVSSPSAVRRHSAKLAQYGLPVPCSSLSIDQTSVVHLPNFVGILESDGRHRVVAVSGSSGEVSDPVSRLLTEHIARVRPLLAV